MKKRKILFAIVTTLAALFITCSIAFASNAVVDSNTYTHAAKFNNCMVIDGVDVSYVQTNIDWEKIKRRGIDFAFIRLGFTYQANPFRMNMDDWFATNMKNAKEAGVIIGVYYYSMATSMTEAQKEANFVVNALKGYDIDLPVIYDCEMDGRLRTAYKSWPDSTRKASLTSNSLAFLKVIQDAGYEPMFYSYMNMMNTNLNMSLIEDKYKVWYAQYNTSPDYNGNYQFWQYTSSGKITGISGRVDCNFWYYDNAAEETVPGTKSIKDSTITLGTSSFTYTKYQQKPSVTVRYNGAVLTEGTDYKLFYIKNALAGTGYAMVKGIGDYSNTALKSFTIRPRTASSFTVAAIPDQEYSGSAKKPAVKVSYTGNTLEKNLDYTVSYSNNVNTGTATVKITGMRNYTGTITKTFKIIDAAPKFSGTTSYSKGPGSAPFKLNITSTSKADLQYKSSDTSIATVDADGKVTLNGKMGTAVITVTSPATDNYTSASTTVEINVGAGAAEITTESDSYTKDADSGSFLLNASSNSGGTLSYSSSNTAIATVTSEGKVNLTGKTGTVKITITSAKTSIYDAGKKTVTVNVTNSVSKVISGVKNTTLKIYSDAKKGCTTISWKKSNGYFVDGYELYRSTNKTSGFSKIYTSVGTKVKNTKNLVSGQRYYYKVRGFRMINGEKVYTNWTITIFRTAK